MADIRKSMELLKKVEHSNRNDKLLHKNKGETGLTFFGIYETAHPNWKGWRIIKAYMELDEDWKEYLKTEDRNDLSLALRKISNILANVSDLNQIVIDFYKTEFWDKARLDEIKSQKIADEIFIFGVNVGMKTAAIKAQFLVDAVPDGKIGNKTIEALNKFDENKFDILFDEQEVEHYDKLVKLHSRFQINQTGWHNRAYAV